MTASFGDARPLGFEQFREHKRGGEMTATSHIEVVVPVGMAGVAGMAGGQLDLVVGGMPIVAVFEEAHAMEAGAMPLNMGTAEGEAIHSAPEHACGLLGHLAAGATLVVESADHIEASCFKCGSPAEWHLVFKWMDGGIGHLGSF